MLLPWSLAPCRPATYADDVSVDKAEIEKRRH
jgi:hypothetical protein